MSDETAPLTETKASEVPVSTAVEVKNTTSSSSSEWKGVTMQEITGRPVFAPWYSPIHFKWLIYYPLFCGIIIPLLFVLEVLWGILVFPCCPKWIMRFFRDLCNRPVSAEEEKQIHDSILETIVRKWNTSPQPPAYPNKFHSKPHGIMKATFEVASNIPAELQIGLFKQQAKYDAVLRTSEPDHNRDSTPNMGSSHGFAVKLVGVPNSLDGKPILLSGEHAEWAKAHSDTAFPPTEYENDTHEMDFLSVPQTFNFAFTTRDFAWANLFLSPGESLLTKLRAVLYLPAILLLMRARKWFDAGAWAQKDGNPLSWSYHSIVPHKFGPDRVVKFHWMRDRSDNMGTSPKGHSEIDMYTPIQNDMLAKGSITYGFYLQFQPKKDDPNFSRFPVEDHWTNWCDRTSKLFRFGTLTIHQGQKVNGKEGWALAEIIGFNPWQTTASHEPIGNHNRARQRVYHVMSTKKNIRLNSSKPPRCPFMLDASANNFVGF